MARKAKVSQPPVWLLSIDPAAAAGWALFKEGKPHSWGAADGSTWKGLMKALKDSWVPELLAEEEFQTRECCIEDGFFQYGKQTFKGTLTLGRRRGLAQAAAEAVGIDKFTFVGPSTWQNGLGWRRGLDTKIWALEYVKQRWGIEGISHDTSDSLALGGYFVDNYAALA